jgi:hypothetical protein
MPRRARGSRDKRLKIVYQNWSRGEITDGVSILSTLHSSNTNPPSQTAAPNLYGNELIDKLLERSADLRKSYTFLTKREAPAEWHNPDWSDCDPRTLKEVMAEDFLLAFTEYGVDVREAYSEYYIWDADGYDTSWDWRHEQIRRLVSDVVDFRVRRRLRELKGTPTLR